MLAEWQYVNLGVAVDVNPPRELQRGCNSVYVAMEQLQPNSRAITSFSYRNFTGSGARFRNNDTLLARITPCLENGKTTFVNCLRDKEVAHGSTEFIVLSGKEGITDNLYVYYLARLPGFREFAISLMEGSSGRQRVPSNALKRFEFYLPPLPEQKEIAHILSTLDDKIELNQQINRNLEAIASAIFKSWFVDFDPVRAKMEGRQPTGMDAATTALFPDSFEDSSLGEIPKGWRVSTIGESVRVVGGSTPSTKEPAYWESGTIHWATPKDLASLSSSVIVDTERRITELGLQQISSGLLPIGTVLLSSRAPIGYLAIAEVPLAINQGFIAMICDRELPNHYILQWTRANMNAIKGRANGTTFLEISKTNFRPLNVVVPSSRILQYFTEQAAVLHQQLVTNLEQSRTLTTIRDTLLPKLMSGEIRVKEAEKILEDVA